MADDAVSGRAGRKLPPERRIGQAHGPAAAVRQSPGGRRRAPGPRRRDRGIGGPDLRRNVRRYLSVARRALRRGVEHVVGSILMPCRERPVRLALPPVETAADINLMLEAITTAVRRGGISPGEAAALAEVADTYLRVIETTEFDRRLRALEVARAAQS